MPAVSLAFLSSGAAIILRVFNLLRIF